MHLPPAKYDVRIASPDDAAAARRRFRLVATTGTPWSNRPAHGWTAMNQSHPRRCPDPPGGHGGLTFEFIAETG